MGLPGRRTNRRTPGLRREEVALLAGVSHTWYTWLEQGRDIRPSRQVVDALARTLRMSTAEREYVLRLAGHDDPVASVERTGRACRPHLQRLMDALGPSPAYAITSSWSIVGWNRAYERLYPGVADLAPAADRNLLWVVFTDPAVRELLGDWSTDSRRFLTQFRAEVGPRLADPEVVDLVTRLRGGQPRLPATAGPATTSTGSPPASAASSTRRSAALLLEHHQLTPADAPGLQLVVYTAAEGTDTAARLSPRELGAG